jgi:hypothetical protein
MADVMPQMCEEGLNVDNFVADSHDVTRQLFTRSSWFDRLRAACFADIPVTVIDGAAGSARCRLYFAQPASGRLSALANWYSFRWMPQFDDPNCADNGDALTSAFKAARRHGFRLTMAPVPEEGGVAEQIRAALRKAGWTMASVLVSRSHWLETDGRNFADWWDARPGRLRSTVARKAKKGVVAFTIHTDFDDTRWDEYEAVYTASWKGAEGNPAYLRDWARASAREGALRLGIARIDGRPVAAQFWTVDSGTAHIHKLAQISDETIESYSPGTLLSHALFAHAFDVDRVARIDFGTGDDGYKRDWMEQSADLVAITAVDLRQPRGWWSLARDGMTRVAGRLHKS